MNGTPKTLAPVAYLSNTAANIFTTGAGLYSLMTEIDLCNTDTAAHTVTLYIGLTGGSLAGTEIMAAEVIPANSRIQKTFYPARTLLTTNFLTGKADTASKVTIEVLGLQAVLAA